MRLINTLRIVKGSLRTSGMKKVYTDVSRTLGFVSCLTKNSNNDFAKVVLRDQLNYILNRVCPIDGHTRESAEAALQWLYLAQDATNDGGVSHGYFPCNPQAKNGWRPSYPETTGYIIETFLDYAKQYNVEEPRERAKRMAAWEVEIQMPCGAVQGGPVCSPEEQVAAVFNTGMVLQGYTAILNEEHDDDILDSAFRAAEFLVNDLDDEGYFKSHGAFVSKGKIKTYNCLCALALYRFGMHTQDARYTEAAIRAVSSAIDQQQDNGWFANNCLSRPETPLLHTIAYAIQGILEVGILSDTKEFIEAARKGIDPIINRMTSKGFLYGRYSSNWHPANHSSCLTGNAQIAVICYRYFEITGDERYRLAADRIVNYLKALQVTDSPNPALNGALAGSFPILWGYMPAGYPNWATKYYLDSLLLQDRLSS